MHTSPDTTAIMLASGHGAHRVAGRERQHDRENHRGERGVRPQHQDAARAEQRVGEQRDDGGVQAVDSRDARGHRVGDSDRHQHRGQHQAGHQIVRQPGGFVPAAASAVRAANASSRS